MLSEGMSLVTPAPTTNTWTHSTWPALLAVCFKALPQTASCLSPLPGVESQLGHERMMPVTWGEAVDFSGFLHQLQLPRHALAAIWQKN